MRNSGVVGDTRELMARDHVCWHYTEPAAFHEDARRYLEEGLMAGERALYVGRGDPAELREHFRGLTAAAPKSDPESLQIESLSDMYADGEVVDPVAQLELFMQALQHALDDGFTGLRVVAELSSMVRTPQQVEAFARWEHLGDRAIAASSSLSSLCAYHHDSLPSETIAEMACLHPLSNIETVPFRLFAEDDHGTALSGEIDAASIDLFTRSLQRIDVEAAGGEVVLDVDRLQFIDHRGLFALDEFARRHDATVGLRNLHSMACRLITLLELDDLRVMNTV